MPPVWKLPRGASRLSNGAGNTFLRDTTERRAITLVKTCEAVNSLVLPNEAKKLTALWMDWNLKVGILEVH